MNRLFQERDFMDNKERDLRLFPPSKGYIVWDLELCTGCHVCEAICSFVKEGRIRPEASRIQVSMDPFAGTVENCTPHPCLQCAEPQCMLSCPVNGAMSIDEKTGARLIHASQCPPTCRECLDACGARFSPPRILFHPEKKICMKCDLCDGAPECVKWCPNGALRLMPHSEFVERGRAYRFNFTEGCEKDFGPSFEQYEGPKWRYTGAWLGERGEDSLD